MRLPCHDMKLVRQTLESVPTIVAAKREEFLPPESASPLDTLTDVTTDKEPDLEVPVPESGLCLDAGYDYEEVREVRAEFGYTTHIRCRGEEKGESGQTARAKGQEMGRGAYSLVAQPFPSLADSMGQESQVLPRFPPLRLCHSHLESMPIWIGS